MHDISPVGETRDPTPCLDANRYRIVLTQCALEQDLRLFGVRRAMERPLFDWLSDVSFDSKARDLTEVSSRYSFQAHLEPNSRTSTDWRERCYVKVGY